MASKNSKKSMIWLIFGLLLLAASSWWLWDFSLIPFGKRHLPFYSIEDSYARLKNYIPEGPKLIMLNDLMLKNNKDKYMVGISGASDITEYSSSKAMEKFGQSGKYGALRVSGNQAQIKYGKESKVMHDKKMVFSFVHSNRPLPERSKPNLAAVVCYGKNVDSLYIGDIKYFVQKDSQLFLQSDALFYVNSYKAEKVNQQRPLIIFRNGQQQQILTGIKNIQTMDSQLFFYDDRIANYNNWAANTIIVIKNVGHKTFKSNDKRLFLVNGKEPKIDFDYLQVTGGTVHYLNGISGFKTYGFKGIFGAINVRGEGLKYFITKEK